MLYVVPTPLGNLEDMPPRALRALKESAVVYCEDTRRTRNLMSHFGLSTPLERYDESNARSVDKLLERGVYAIGFSFPVVPQGKARIRVQVSAAHSSADLDFDFTEDPKADPAPPKEVTDLLK